MDHAKYSTCDARDLSAYYGNDCDLVIFSLNGIDSVDHDDRNQIIEEARKVIAPDGVFFFSTHLIGSFTFKAPLPHCGRDNLLRFVYRCLNQMFAYVKVAWIYKSMPLNEIRNRNWAILGTSDQNFTMSIFHINPAFQVAAPEKLGFRTEAIINPSGMHVSANEAGSPWCYFFATPA
jgi:SAM-dependent methyltransferase